MEDAPADRGNRRRRGRGLALDAAVALVVASLQVGITLAASRHVPFREPVTPVGLALLAAGPAALVWRRRAPVAVLAVVFGATLAYWLLDEPRGPTFLALVVAYFTAMTRGHREVAWASLAAGYLAFVWLRPLLTADPWPEPAEAVGLAAWLLLLGAVGEWARTRRAYVRAMEQRALEAERTREEEALRRASEERLRIARELHDVVAHHISLINVQAGVALHLIDERPEQARGALAAIRDASKDALTELRSVLGVLRQVDEGAPRTPAPGLAGLGELVSRAEAAGLTVHTEMEGEPRAMSAATDLAAFRILQEALTNVTKHAGPATARVRIVYGDDALTLEVEDDGRGSPGGPDREGGGDHAEGGAGIPGMRERAEAAGGSLSAGPRSEGGWRVAATLPFRRAR